MQLLLIEDNEDDYLLLSWYAAKIGDIKIEWRDSLQRGLAYIASNPVDVLLLDLALPDAHGLATLDQVQKQFPTLPIIILSGTDDDEVSLDAVHRGAQDYLVKGHIDDWILKKSVRYAVERKQTEQALVTERNLLRTLIDSMPDYIFVKDAQGRLIITNMAHAQMAGTTPDDVIGKTAFDMFPPDLAEQFYEDDERVMKSGEPLINLESDIIDAEGQIKTLLITKIPLQDEYGQSTGLVSISRDITDRKQVEEKFRQERDLLRALIDSTPDYIFIKDAQKRFVITNEAHARAVKAGSDELVGKTASEVFPPELAKQYHVDDDRVIQSGEPLINLERSTINEHGNTITVLTSKIPLMDRDGQVIYVVGISRDITERKQLEARSIELAGERERIRVLQRFIDDMSHDLRTPLAVVGSSLYLLQKNTDPDKQQVHTQKIEHQLLRLDNLLNEMLEMAQLDRHDTRLQTESTEINAYLKPIIQEYEAVAAAKQITIEFDLENKPCLVHIDKVEFASAIIKLLENAINYTPEGGSITISTHTWQDQTIISVQDNGIGIAAQDLPHIFERFYRADQARSTATGGHGLGLSIAQSIIEAHGGSIKGESAAGRGSTFTVTLLNS